MTYHKLTETAQPKSCWVKNLAQLQKGNEPQPIISELCGRELQNPKHGDYYFKRILKGDLG